MNAISSLISGLPGPFSRALALASPATSGSSPSSKAASNTSTPSNQLDANSFITLLAAQLQAQDPLNPLDPNQMVDELTSMNTLQQTIQIRQDLDALLQAAQAGATPASATSSNQSALASSPIAAFANLSSQSAIAHNAALAAAKFALSHANSKL